MNHEHHNGKLNSQPRRAETIFHNHSFAIARRTDRLLRWLLILQWLAGIAAAVWFSPRKGNGTNIPLYLNVLAAIFLGGIISCPPIFLSVRWPGSLATRHTISAGQMMMSALLFHLFGGRIEMRSYIFGSLAFVSFYRDWQVLATATFIAALNHLATGFLWPESVYGVVAGSAWRTFERAGWVVFEDIFLLISMQQSIHEMHKIARRQALLESVNERIEHTVVERTSELTSEIAERSRAEKSLRVLQLAVAQSKDSVIITDADLDLPGPRITFVNPAYTKMTGYSAEEVIGKTPRLLQGPRTDREVLRNLRQNLESGEEFEGETINYRKDGRQYNVEWRIAPIRDPLGVTTHFVAIQRDITERRRIEAQLAQSQKLETLGRLAGGFAHEFNTILSSIIGQSEMIFAALPPGSSLVKNTGEIRSSAGRAAKLTSQLLAYGRKQMLQPRTLDLNVLLTKMWPVIAELTGEQIVVEFNLADVLHSIRADRIQIEEAILHVVNNARDAMPDGGKLTVSTDNIVIDEESVNEYHGMKQGDYIVLAIADTGIGMSAEIKAHAFDPFYSTKGVGKGTGLGLATCYGIVKQSGGYLQLESEIAAGTTLRIYLPKATAKTSLTIGASAPDPSFRPRNRKGTILVVESDITFSNLAVLVLEKSGYEVLAATDQDEAVSVAERAPKIDLLLASVAATPFYSRALATKIRSFHPTMKTLFTSPRHEDAATHRSSSEGTTYFLRKPFTPAALGSEIQYIINGVGANREREVQPG